MKKNPYLAGLALVKENYGTRRSGGVSEVYFVALQPGALFFNWGGAWPAWW